LADFLLAFRWIPAKEEVLWYDVLVGRRLPTRRIHYRCGRSYRRSPLLWRIFSWEAGFVFARGFLRVKEIAILRSGSSKKPVPSFTAPDFMIYLSKSAVIPLALAMGI